MDEDLMGWWAPHGGSFQPIYLQTPPVSAPTKALKPTYPKLLIPPDGDESSTAVEMQRRHHRSVLILRHVSQQAKPMRVIVVTKRSHHVDPDACGAPLVAIEG